MGVQWELFCLGTELATHLKNFTKICLGIRPKADSIRPRSFKDCAGICPKSIKTLEIILFGFIKKPLPCAQTAND